MQYLNQEEWNLVMMLPFTVGPENIREKNEII